MSEARSRGVIVEPPRPGDEIRIGALPIEVIGPQRRYLAENDGSIVLWVGTQRTLLLAGDIGAVAQRELPELNPDVLLVPHHGAATTDPTWLERTVGATAIISVGPNTYGHPAPEILEVLRSRPIELYITADDGDVTLPLAGASEPARSRRR